AQHGEVALQAVERIPESRGHVALEEEMPDPRKRVSGNRYRPQQMPLAVEEGPGQERERKRSADHVQSPRGGVAVLAQVIRVELAEARETLCPRAGFVHGDSSRQS